MGTHLQTILGHKVRAADDRSHYGIKHLAYELEDDEVRELFKQSENGKRVEFQDKDGRRFVLVDGENGAFEVVATNIDHGWF